MVMLSNKDYVKLKKDVNTILINHANGGFVLDLSYEKQKVYLDYYNLCQVWHFYIVQLVEIEDYETCEKIRQIIEEEKEETIRNMTLAGIYEIGIDSYLDLLEEAARKIQGEKNDEGTYWEDEE